MNQPNRQRIYAKHILMAALDFMQEHCTAHDALNQRIVRNIPQLAERIDLFTTEEIEHFLYPEKIMR